VNFEKFCSKPKHENEIKKFKIPQLLRSHRPLVDDKIGAKTEIKKRQKFEKSFLKKVEHILKSFIGVHSCKKRLQL
jgi:hypothetical protein